MTPFLFWSQTQLGNTKTHSSHGTRPWPTERSPRVPQSNFSAAFLKLNDPGRVISFTVSQNALNCKFAQAIVIVSLEFIIDAFAPAPSLPCHFLLLLLRFVDLKQMPATPRQIGVSSPGYQ
jgi:hypothetical protein